LSDEIDAWSAGEARPGELAYAGGLCPIRSHLLKEACLAAENASNLSGEVFAYAGTNHHKSFSTAIFKLRKQLVLARAAREEYRRHLEEHGCG